MIPDVSLVLGTVKACAEAVVEIFRWLSTPEGQAFSKQSREDRAQWEADWKKVGQWFNDLFTGKLFKQKQGG